MPPVIKVENLSKMYRLGEVGTGTVRDDLARAWAKLRGKEDPFQKVGQVNRRDEAADGDHEYVWALQDINFEVEQGEILGIIGRNGAGKSTLLKLLSRITSPTTGRIRARGRIASLLEVGTGFHPELSGRDNIYLNGALLGMTRREVTNRLEEIVEFSGCAKYIDTPVKRYSSGMMVRLGFSVAAHLECEILIVDEVLAVGDAEFQKRCLGKMGDVARDGRTILFVSHNMSSVEALCSNGIVLHQGRVHFAGNLEGAITHYLDTSSASLNVGSRRFGEPAGGMYDVWITDVSVTSSDGQGDGIIKNDQPMIVSVGVQTKRPVRCPELGIGIDASQHQRVTTLHTTFVREFDREMVDGHFVIRCKISGLALVPGAYSLKLALDPVAGPRHELEGVCGFTVVGSSRYSETGKHGRGIVLCQQEWCRVPSEASPLSEVEYLG